LVLNSPFSLVSAICPIPRPFSFVPSTTDTHNTDAERVRRGLGATYVILVEL
jgi:hypothetical protein